jgi:hypothetical protein
MNLITRRMGEPQVTQEGIKVAQKAPLQYGLSESSLPDKQYFILLGVLLGIFAGFYASKLTMFSIAIDDEYGAFRQSVRSSGDLLVWLSQGRWTMYLFLRFVMPQATVPFLPVASFGLFLSIGYVFIINAFADGRGKFVYIITFPIFAAFPIWLFLIEHAANAAGIGLGVLLVGIAIFLFRSTTDEINARGAWVYSPKLLKLVIAEVMLLGAAIGVYQSLVFLYGTLGIGLILAMSGKYPPRTLIRFLSHFVLVIFISVILYAIVLFGAIRVAGTPISYIQGFIRSDLLLTEPLRVIWETVKQGWYVYSGDAAVFGTRARGLGVPILLGVTGLFFLGWRLGGLRATVLHCLTIALFCLPFAMNLLNGGFMPYRSLVAVPAVLWVLALIGLREAPHAISRAGFFLLVLMYFDIVYIASNFQASAVLVRIHDQMLASTIYERVTRLFPDFDSKRRYKIDFYGAKEFITPYPRIFDSAIGASFFEWDAGNPHRIVAYMRLIGFTNLDVVQEIELVPVFREYYSMHSWPAADSVRLTDNNIILVRLSDSDTPGLIRAHLPEMVATATNPIPLYQLSNAAANSWTVDDVTNLNVQKTGVFFFTGNDSKIFIKTGAEPSSIHSCVHVQAKILIQVERADVAQLFYKRPKQVGFEEAVSARIPVQPVKNGFARLTIDLINPGGFEDDFRFDPVEQPQEVTIKEIELYCGEKREEYNSRR